MNKINRINRSIIFTLIVALTQCSAEEKKAIKPVDAEIILNGRDELVLNEVGPAQLVLRFSDFNEEGVLVQLNDFEAAHAKFMHMVVVPHGLEYMSHVHPTYNKEDGTFSITLNTDIPNDFDNQDNVNVIRGPGLYHVVAEAKSVSRGFVMKKFDLVVRGNSPRVDMDESPLLNDEARVHVAYFDAEGNTLSYGAPYKLVFQYTITPGDGGELVAFNAVATRYNASTDTYEKIENFVPWMHMGAHVIMFSKEGETVEEKSFLHLHSQDPQDPDLGVNLDYSHFNRGKLKNNEVYKFWTQFTHCQEGYVVKRHEMNGVSMRVCKTPEEGDDEHNMNINPRVLVKAPIVINFQDLQD